MTNSALEIWKEVYINGEVGDDTSFVAIDLLLNGFSSKEKKRILNEVFSTFKSTFVAYRFIYFNFIKDDIPDDEQVKVVNPYDLTSLDVKNDDDFQKRTKTQTQGFVYGVSTCPYCNSTVYDNREDKRNPRAPDFKCSARSPQECSAHNGTFAKAWWLNSKDLPPEWSSSTSVVYDDDEKNIFKNFCKEQVKKVYPKLKSSYTYSHREKKLLNTVWINSKDSNLIKSLNEPLLRYKKLSNKLSIWRTSSSTDPYTPKSSPSYETRSYPDGGYRNSEENKRNPESKDAPEANVSESATRSHLSHLDSHPHFIKKVPILKFASHFNIGSGWKNRNSDGNSTNYGGPMDTSKDLTMGAVYPFHY